MQTYGFGGKVCRHDDPRFDDRLAKAYSDGQRPQCLCRLPAGVPMYVSRLGNRHVLKRMPNSGWLHHPGCESYEPPPELSGLGQLADAAIIEDVEAGRTTLKLDFSLTRVASRAPPVVSGADGESVKSDGSRLTLRAVLHYLWDQANLNRWTPAMTGKRSWYVVRKHLLAAAADKAAKGGPLGELLFIPETFSVERKDEIQARRIAALARLSAPAGSTRKLMLLIGEVKSIEAGRHGQKVLVKHLPDLPFMLPSDLHNRMVRRFQQELELWNADPSTHLVIASTFGADAAGVLSLEELCLVVTTGNWIPVENLPEVQLLHALTSTGRRFTKGLRYNLGSDRPLASVVLSDVPPTPVALYAVPPDAGDAFWKALDQLQQSSRMASWVWRPSEEPMPALPLQGSDGQAW